MVRLGSFTFRFLVLIALAVLSLTSACRFQRGGSDAPQGPGSFPGSEAPQSNGQGFGGTRPNPTDEPSLRGFLNAQNGRTRCHYRELGSSYEVTCRAVVITPAGNEVLAKGVEEGVTLEWADKPVVVDGGQAPKNSSCSVSGDQLTQTCEITLENQNGSRLRFDLKINEKVESDTVFLPFSVSSYGEVLQLGAYNVDTSDEASLFGLQSIDGAPLKSFIGRPYSACSKGTRLYFSAENYIFVLESNRLKVYAGSTNPANRDNLSHRLRVSLGMFNSSSTPNALELICQSDSLWVADSGNARILEIKDSGPIRLVASLSASESYLQSPQPKPGDEDEIFLFDKKKIQLTRVNKAGIRTLDRLLSPLSPSTNTIPFSMFDGSRLFRSRNGDLYFANRYQITKVTLSGEIIRVAGIRHTDTVSSKDGTFASNAKLITPSGIYVNDVGEIYFREVSIIRKFDSQGALRTIADLGLTAEQIHVFQVNGFDYSYLSKLIPENRSVFPSQDGTLIIPDGYHLRVLSLRPGEKLTSIAGGQYRNQAPAKMANVEGLSIGRVNGIAYDTDGTIYFSESLQNRIRKIDPVNKKVSLVIGSTGGRAENRSYEGMKADQIPVSSPTGLVIKPEGLYFLASGVIGFIDRKGIYSTVARISTGNLVSFVIAPDGSFIVASSFPDWIYKVRRGGKVSTLLDVPRIPPDGGLRKLYKVGGMSIGPDGALYIADTGHHRIMKLAALKYGAAYTRVAGNPNALGEGLGAGDSGDGDPSKPILFSYPSDLKVDPDGTIYVTDSGNGKIRKLAPVLTPKGNIKYLANTVVGGRGEKDCSGTIRKSISEENYGSEVKTSLSMLCHSQPILLQHVNTCGSQDGGEGSDLTVFSQLFGPGNFTSNSQFYDSPSNIVVVEKACTK